MKSRPDSSIRALNLNENPGLVGTHKHIQHADANAKGWAKFCAVLTLSRVVELKLRQVGMGPRALSELASKLKCEGANPSQLSRSLTALDLSDNCLFGFQPDKSDVESSWPHRQTRIRISLDGRLCAERFRWQW